MPEELRTRVKSTIKEGAPVDRGIFDVMEAEVTRAITDTTYQAFLRSDVYVAYVGAATQPLSSPEPDSGSTHKDVSFICFYVGFVQVKFILLYCCT